MSNGYTTKQHRKGEVVNTTHSFTMNTGANSIIRKLGLKCASDEAVAERALKKAKQAESHARKEERCKLTDEEVRILRRAHEIDKKTMREVHDEFGAKYNLTIDYVRSLLNYATRSKVYI